LFCNNDGGLNSTGIFSMTRNQGWFDAATRCTGYQVNGMTVNPVDGSVLYTQYTKTYIFYLDKKTSKGVNLLSLTTTISLTGNYVMYLCFSPDGKYLYIAMAWGTSGKVFRADWDFATKTLSNLSLIIDMDYLLKPEQITCDKEGNLYICDTGHHIIDIWDPLSQKVTTFAGTRDVAGLLDGEPLKATFNYPTGICIGNDGTIYIADNGNHRIRKIVVE
jgi:DNA-binding beta-propeller fold protein YncE